MKVFNRDVAVDGKLLRKGGVATAASGAATLNGYAGVVTSEALTTTQNSFYTLTLTNDKITADSLVFVSVGNGTNSAGTIMLAHVTPASGSVVISIQNKHASAVAFNGTLKVSFFVVNTR